MGTFNDAEQRLRVMVAFGEQETGEEVCVDMEEPARFKSFREEYADLRSPIHLEGGADALPSASTSKRAAPC
jgi:hypothetical protein